MRDLCLIHVFNQWTMKWEPYKYLFGEEEAKEEARRILKEIEIMPEVLELLNLNSQGERCDGVIIEKFKIGEILTEPEFLDL